MDITLSFGWWLMPLAVTFAAFIWQWWMHKDDIQADGYSAIGQGMGQALTFLVALVASLIAWLVYFVVI